MTSSNALTQATQAVQAAQTTLDATPTFTSDDEGVRLLLQTIIDGQAALLSVLQTQEG